MLSFELEFKKFFFTYTYISVEVYFAFYSILVFQSLFFLEKSEINIFINKF